MFNFSNSSVCFFDSSNLCLFTEKESSARISKSIKKIYKIVMKREKRRPKKIKVLKTIRAPKRTIAQDAPSKKLIILSNISFCIFVEPSALQQLLHQQGIHK